LSRRVTVRNKPVEITAEYKFASGGSDPGRSGTFDQLYPANHDKFGHEDLFGWKNIHNVRVVATADLFRNFRLTFMYDSHWLADPDDALYNGAGRPILRASSPNAGRHVGQEADVYFTYKYSHFQFGAGYGHFFAGTFVKNTSPGVNPAYAYVFHTYSF
jgi:hypothetical protein